MSQQDDDAMVDEAVQKLAAYHKKLDEHSFAYRYDPLRDAARAVVSQWAQEDEQERNDLSEEFWVAVGNLGRVLESMKRG